MNWNANVSDSRRGSSNSIMEAPTLEPSFETFNTATEILIIAHLPGVVKEEVKLSGDEKSLTVKIVGPNDKEQLSRMGYYSHEITRLYGFSKTIVFPAKVDFSRCKATFKHGALEVRMPKIK
ncbi:MAG: Hsp20/alpha crystallin family protein [Candidatus Micrarchaeota archaeon]